MNIILGVVSWLITRIALGEIKKEINKTNGGLLDFVFGYLIILNGLLYLSKLMLRS